MSSTIQAVVKAQHDIDGKQEETLESAYQVVKYQRDSQKQGKFQFHFR